MKHLIYHHNGSRIETYGNCEFNPNIELEDADAYFCWGGPTRRFLNYTGVKSIYEYEALSHSVYRSTAEYRALFKRRNTGDFLHFANNNTSFRVPHVTCYGQPSTVKSGTKRVEEAVTIVSNYGGKFWRLKSGTRRRNAFICNPRVKLYGRKENWNRFRWLFKTGSPANYVGEVCESYVSESHFDFLAKYKVCVCLENTIEPYYFTEKLPNAIRAGCIPIYEPHLTVTETFIKNVKYVNPADFNYNINDTLDFALAQNIDEYQKINFAWLNSDEFRRTTDHGVWQRIAEAFECRLEK